MKIANHNQFCEDTIYSTIRMNKAEYLALREYMHTKPGDDIWFPYGTTIVKHGYGWYYMSPTCSKRAVEKMAFAHKVIKMFLAEEEAKVDAEIKRLMPTIIDIDLSVATFSNMSGSNEFGYIGAVTQRPASEHKLAKLAAKFSKGKKNEYHKTQ
jgi:hypothetical protein